MPLYLQPISDDNYDTDLFREILPEKRIVRRGVLSNLLDHNQMTSHFRMIMAVKIISGSGSSAGLNLRVERVEYFKLQAPKTKWIGISREFSIGRFRGSLPVPECIENLIS
jgi:hypothetical protein